LKSIPARTRNYIILMILFWLVLSIRFDVLHVTLGIISVVFVFLLHRKLLLVDFFPAGKNSPGIRTAWFLFSYLPWLIWQIITSSFHVAHVILSPRRLMNPSLVRFKTNLPTMTSKVILGTSITLTPGTLTLDIQGDEFWIHALTSDAYAAIENGDLPDRVGRLYSPKAKKAITEIEIVRLPGRS